jgi:hypothetical protein
MNMRRLLVGCGAAVAALVLGGTAPATPPDKEPFAWDFVDVGLCGYPIRSVGFGTLSAKSIDRRQLAPLFVETGPATITTTNLDTGASLTFQVPAPIRDDFRPNALSFLGQTWAVGIGLPYAVFRGSLTFDFDTFAFTARGTFAGYDLCRALAPTTVFFAPRATAPPWSLPVAPLAGAYANNLVPFFVIAHHVHSHLEIYMNGSHVTIPAGVGIVDPAPPQPGDPCPEEICSAAGIYAPLHTHDATGIVHVEAAMQPFEMTVGQFFDIWQVRLTDGCLGATCGGLRAWVNGVEWMGDVRSIPFTAHDEIVVAAGPPYPDPVPSSYDFPEGI